MAGIGEVIHVWSDHLGTVGDWRELVEDIEPKATGCGRVYDLANPLDRPNESIAIADMSDLPVSEPHYHANGETELYYVLDGSGLVVIGCKRPRPVIKGDVVITSPDIAHYTRPAGKLVLAVINTPPFNPANYIVVTESNPDVEFDREQFERLAS